MLEILSKEIPPPWTAIDNSLYQNARSKEPNYLGIEETTRLAISRERYDELTFKHFMDPESSKLILENTSNTKLAQHIGSDAFTPEDLEMLEPVLPEIIAVVYNSRRDYIKSIRMHLSNDMIVSAEKSTVDAIVEASTDMDARDDTLWNIVAVWNAKGGIKRLSGLFDSSNSSALLLLLLCDSPLDAARLRGANSVTLFGSSFVKRAVLAKGLSQLDICRSLQLFGPNEFGSEISSRLISEFENNMIDAVRWYHDLGDLNRAKALADERILSWSEEDLIESIVGEFGIFPSGVIAACSGLGCLSLLIEKCLQAKTWNLDLAVEATNQAVRSREDAENHYERLMHIWHSRRTDQRVKKLAIFPRRKRKNPSEGSLFIAITINPKAVANDDQKAKLAMKRFGAKVIEACVSLTLSDGSDLHETLQKFDAGAFEHRRPNPNSATEPQLFAPNDRVELHGLINKALNGQQGTVKNLVTEGDFEGRYRVQLDSSTQAKAVWAKNMRKIRPQQPREAADADLDSGDDDEASDQSMLPELEDRDSSSISSSGSSSDDS